MTTRMTRGARALALFVAVVLLGAGSAGSGDAAAARPQVAGPAYAFTNGRWLVRGRFVRATRWSVGGVLTDTAPARVDSTLDLGGGWVVPAFGDAHTHNLDGSFNLDTVRARYLREGTFYVQVLTNSRSGAEEVRSRWNRPCELDVVYANGGLTSTLSHPFLAYEPRAMGLYSGWAEHAAEIRRSRKAEGDSYFFLDSLSDVAGKWPAIMAGRPDLLKIFLLDAAEHPAAAPDTGLPTGPGLRPSLVPEVVHRAHSAGLRVAAHVETASDFRIAVDAGVDLFAHLPGYELPVGADTVRYMIDEATARRAGRRGIVATPTLSLVGMFDGPTDSATIMRRRRTQKRNIMLLRRHGVRIVIGSDWYGRTAAGEYAAFAATRLWSPAELLRIWGEETSRSIFPRRLIGRLEPGWEASFLVFESNPTLRYELPPIRMRVKQGCLITL